MGCRSLRRGGVIAGAGEMQPPRRFLQAIGVGPQAITTSGLRAQIAASSGFVTSARSPSEPSSLTAVTAQGACVMP